MGRSISLVKADFLPQCNLSRCFLTSAGSFSRLTSASLPAFIEMLRKIERQLNFQSASALNPDGRETPQADTDSYYSKRLAKIFEFVKSFAKKKAEKISAR